MGDIIEFTTRAQHPNSFYKVSSNAISFKVKTENAALVGVAIKPGQNCEYWLGIGGGRAWIKGPEGIKTKQGSMFQLSQNEFKKFWIFWDSNNIRFGVDSDKTTMLMHSNTLSIKYVIFTTPTARHAATWKLELPPACLNSITKVPYKRLQGGELYWKKPNVSLPDDSVIGGYLNECIYIIRAEYRGSLTPGYFVPSEETPLVSWGGAANTADDFEVLCGYNFKWEKTSEDKIPVTAFEAGYSEANHEKLYIGRVRHEGTLIPGKVHPTHRVCYVCIDDREVPFKEFEILTLPESNPYPTKPYFEIGANWRPMIVNENAFFMNHEDNNHEQSDYDSDESAQRDW